MSTKLNELLERGLAHEGFREGFEARDAVIRLGDMLRRVREAANLSQAQLARKVGMTQPAVSRLEKGFGRRGPEVDTIMRFVHGCDMELVVQVRERPAAAPAVAAEPPFQIEDVEILAEALEGDVVREDEELEVAAAPVERRAFETEM